MRTWEWECAYCLAPVHLHWWLSSSPTFDRCAEPGSPMSCEVHDCHECCQQCVREKSAGLADDLDACCCLKGPS